MNSVDLAVLGLGYVGLPVAIAANEVGLRVVGYDPDESKIGDIAAGRSYLPDVADDLIAQARDRGLEVSSSPEILRHAAAYSICVPTPLIEGRPDLSAVEAAAATVGAYLAPGDLVVLESTTFPGTTDELLRPLLEEASGLKAGSDFGLAYSPERIDPGNGDWTLRNTPKIVAGIDASSTDAAMAIYNKFCDTVVQVAGVREAEMAKMIENTYRNVNIALVNEMVLFSRMMGIDVREAIRAAATKPFGFEAFYPGPGVGGHCIPVDPLYLIHRVRELGSSFRLAELADSINRSMPSYVAERAVEMLAARGRSVAGAEVVLIGVAYKANVGDTRESPAFEIVTQLRSIGANVSYVDPLVADFVVDGEPVVRHEDPLAAALAADLAIVVTPHDSLDFVAIGEAAAVLDTRGVVPRGLAEHL